MISTSEEQVETDETRIGFSYCRPIGDMSITRNLMSILKPPKGGFAFGVKGFAPLSTYF
jgi:hypothetical protein